MSCAYCKGTAYDKGRCKGCGAPEPPAQGPLYCTYCALCGRLKTLRAVGTYSPATGYPVMEHVCLHCEERDRRNRDRAHAVFIGAWLVAGIVLAIASWFGAKL